MHRFSRNVQLAVEVLEDRCVPSATIFDLGPGFVASSINNVAMVAGSANGHAALWKDGAVLDLGTLGGASSKANDINEAGQVVGRADTLTGTGHAFLVTPEDTDGNGQPDRWFRDDDSNGINDLMRDLGTLGGSTSEARGINNLGQVVGRADASTAASSYRAFLWDSVAGMQNLGTLGANASEANAINDLGEVAGTVYKFKLGNPYFLSEVNGFHWTPAAGGSLLVWGQHGAAKPTDINQFGQIVGNEGQVASSGSVFSTVYRTNDAALWQNGFRTDLGFTVPSFNLYGGLEFDVSINNHGQVVGLNQLWQEGDLFDLNSLIDPSLGWTVKAASDINDAGMIVGQGTHGGINTSFLLNYDALAPTVTGIHVNVIGIADADWDFGVATITTGLPHRLAVGESITVANMSVAGYNGVGLTVTSVFDAVTFTYAVTGPLADNATGGTMTGTFSNSQRSEVNSLVVTFNTALNTAHLMSSVGAFMLTQNHPSFTPQTISYNGQNGPLGGGINVTVLSSIQVILTFQIGIAGVEAGSLADGSWKLLVDNAAIKNTNGANMAVDYNSAGADNTVLTDDAGEVDINRLFGDSNADGTVDGSDFGDFGSTFGLALGDLGFLAFFDSNDDGTIDGSDFGDFGARFGLSL